MIAIAVLGVLATVASAQAAECEITWQGDVTYTVDRRTRVVAVEAIARPDLGDWSVTCGDPWLGIAVVPGARDLAIGTPARYQLDIEPSSDDKVSSAVGVVFDVRDRDVLRDGVTVSYVMPVDDDWVTVDGTSARFPIWAIGEERGSSVTVVSGTRDAIVASTPRASGESGLGRAVYALDGDAEWDTYASVYFGDYDRVVLTGNLVNFVDRDGSDPDVGVVNGAVAGFAMIERLLGERPTTGKQVDIIEVADGDLSGYAGRYDASFEAIEVDSSLTQGTLLHEIAHAWVNGDAFVDPWLSEGLADYVSMLVERELPDTDGLPPIDAEPILSLGQPLVRWDSEDLDSEGATKRVDYGYAASLWVIDRVANEIGSPELVWYVASIVAATSRLQTPIASAEFLVGLDDEFGFADGERVFADFVFGGVDATAAARAVAPPPVADATGIQTIPVSGIGPGLVAAVAVLLALFVIRSLRSRPLGRSAALIETEAFAGDDDWEIDGYPEDALVDSDWSF